MSYSLEYKFFSLRQGVTIVTPVTRVYPPLVFKTVCSRTTRWRNPKFNAFWFLFAYFWILFCRVYCAAWLYNVYRVAQKSKPPPIFQKKSYYKLPTRLDFFVKLKH